MKTHLQPIGRNPRFVLTTEQPHDVISLPPHSGKTTNTGMADKTLSGVKQSSVRQSPETSGMFSGLSQATITPSWTAEIGC